MNWAVQHGQKYLPTQVNLADYKFLTPRNHCWINGLWQVNVYQWTWQSGSCVNVFLANAYLCHKRYSGTLCHSIALNTLACEIPFLRCYGEVCNMCCSTFCFRSLLTLTWRWQNIMSMGRGDTPHMVRSLIVQCSIFICCLMHCYKCAAWITLQTVTCDIFQLW